MLVLHQNAPGLFGLTGGSPTWVKGIKRIRLGEGQHSKGGVKGNGEGMRKEGK